MRSVEKGSRADKAGFRAGDVIVKINGEAIHDSSDFTHALHSRKENTASISILRDKKEQTLKLNLPERKESKSIWESLELPQLDAETRAELTDLQSEMSELKPELEDAVNRRLALVKPDLERQAREFCRQKAEIKKQLRDLQRELHNHKLEIKRELGREFDENSNEF